MKSVIDNLELGYDGLSCYKLLKYHLNINNPHLEGEDPIYEECKGNKARLTSYLETRKYLLDSGLLQVKSAGNSGNLSQIVISKKGARWMSDYADKWIRSLQEQVKTLYEMKEGSASAYNKLVKIKKIIGDNIGGVEINQGSQGKSQDEDEYYNAPGGPGRW